jgi:hypothetical protein
VSLGKGSARDGRILRSLAAFDVSWKTGMLQNNVKELAYDFRGLIRISRDSTWNTEMLDNSILQNRLYNDQAGTEM